jgi:nicotinamide/nicotinate riboside kinase
VEAHSELFEDGDVENGKLTDQSVKNLVLMEALEMGTGNVVEKCCKILLEHARSHEIVDR